MLPFAVVDEYRIETEEVHITVGIYTMYDRAARYDPPASLSGSIEEKKIFF
jgi:hypothetical protein